MDPRTGRQVLTRKNGRLFYQTNGRKLERYGNSSRAACSTVTHLGGSNDTARTSFPASSMTKRERRIFSAWRATCCPFCRQWLWSFSSCVWCAMMLKCTA